MKKPKPKPNTTAKKKAMPKPKPKPKPAATPRCSSLTPRQEKYAQLAASGMLLKEAARRAGYGRGSERSLKRNAPVQARIVALRAKVEARGEELALITLAEKRRFLTELIRTPVAQVGPESWLVLEWERTETPGRPSPNGRAGKPTVKQKVKLGDKLRAIELDSKLANHFPTPTAAAEQPPASAGSDERAKAESLRAIAERVKHVLPLMWAQR